MSSQSSSAAIHKIYPPLRHDSHRRQVLSASAKIPENTCPAFFSPTEFSFEGDSYPACPRGPKHDSKDSQPDRAESLFEQCIILQQGKIIDWGKLTEVMTSERLSRDLGTDVVMLVQD